MLLWADQDRRRWSIFVARGSSAYLSMERSPNPALKSIKGVPIVVAIVVGLLIVLTYVLNHTAWGRHVYAVGGNTEAARRSGINVFRVKLTCFIMCSTIAAFAGLLIASRNNSVSPTTGGSTTLLFAVGAAVIGGTSLFGGKGRVVRRRHRRPGDRRDRQRHGADAPVDRATSTSITGLVLLVAASVDAISRRRASATGRV